MNRRTYLPAAGSDWLLPFYDPFTRLFGIEAVHRQLIEQAGISPGDRVLEIGCGTGNLSILAKRLQPAAEVIGIDPDPKALSRARRKAKRAGQAVAFDRGFSEELPYPDGSFDKVLSAFMFHHLPPDTKKLALSETRRVLKHSGSLHLVDYSEGNARPHGFHGWLARFMHHSHGSQSDDTVTALMQAAGFQEPKGLAHRPHILGRITYYAGAVPNRQEG